MTNAVDLCRRPGLAYQHAFDWLAVQLQAIDGPIVALVPSEFQGIELLRRLPDISFLNPMPTGLGEVGAGLGLDRVAAANERGKFAAVAWVEPRQEDVSCLEQIRQRLLVNGHIFLVAGGQLASFLAERRQQEALFLTSAEVKNAFKQAGFTVTTQFGLHGPRAILWHYLGEAAGRLGQPHWQDRCHYGMRRAFVKTGFGQEMSALTCMAAERRA